MDSIIRDNKGRFVKGSPPHNKGKHLSDKTKQKLREKNLGKSAWNKGISNPNATKNFGDYAKKGVYSGKNNLFYGNKHTKETIKKMRLLKFKNLLSKDELINYYIYRKFSMEKIAKLTNHSVVSVRRMLLFYKIPIRNYSDALRNRYNNPQEREKVRLFLIENNPMDNPEYREKVSLSKLGDKNPSWKGGISFEPYSVDWTKTLKKAIRERDKYICQICKNEGNHVHHIDYNKKNCNPYNLITLCHRCHSKTNHNRKFWIETFINLKNSII